MNTQWRSTAWFFKQIQANLVVGDGGAVNWYCLIENRFLFIKCKERSIDCTSALMFFLSILKQLTCCNSLWLWKMTIAQVVETSMSTTTVLFRTTFTRTINSTYLWNDSGVQTFHRWTLRFKKGQIKCSCIRVQIMPTKQQPQKNHYLCHDLSAWKKR